MVSPVSVLSLATAVPPHCLDQVAVAEKMQRVFSRTFSRYPDLIKIFSRSGIDRRYSVCPIDWFDTSPHDWCERSEIYLDAAELLYIKATQEALERAGIEATDVDIVVTVSSTGIATPSLEARIGRRLGFRRDIVRVPIFGLGCAGGVSGLAVASRLARAEPGKIVLLVAIELCTLAFRGDNDTKTNVVASALFGDGAASVILQAGLESRACTKIGSAGEYTWPDTLDMMGWSIDPIGFGVVLSRSLPGFVEKHLAIPARRFAKASLPDVAAIRFVCHPGGAKVLSSIETALDLPPDSLTDERDVLRSFGNMSGPSVLFVLERALARKLRHPCILTALGPGFSASFVVLEDRRE